MRFPLKGKEDEYFLIFTTTPWTVPANVVIAVNKNIDYVKIKIGKEKYWIAKKRLEGINEEYEILDKKKGKELKNLEYEMPYKDLKKQKEEKSLHNVVLWDLASEEEGTGIVHVAPGCGSEDFSLGKEKKLPAISPLNEAGIYKEGYGKFSNKKYSEVNKNVLEDLEKRGFVYKIEPYKHRYPHCWRCGEELVYRLVDEWYIKCSEKFRKKLIKNNNKVNWYPEYGKTRQNDWFENMGDWLISRKRYWGLPLPIWECECGKIYVFGSLEELKEKAVNKKKVDSLKEIHRPWIDKIKVKCECGEEVKRIPDVGDAWLDAGIVPFSTLDYLENKKKWKKWYPADLISENMPGQYRGWFNALFWSSGIITGKTPFKAMFGYETLKDENGEEMHKSKGNAIWFDDAVEKIGADPMRLLYCLQSPSQELRFGFNVIKEFQNNLNIIFNLRNLIKNKEGKIKEIEDKWIMSKLNSLTKKVTDELENLHPHISTREIQDFWLNSLSRGYVQFIRKRLREGDKNAHYVLKETYIKLLKLFSPVCPFITEKIWQDLKEKGVVEEDSIHLTGWPKSDKKEIDKKLEEDMDKVFEIIEKGMAIRDKEGIGLKWPLPKVEIKIGRKINKKLEEIIMRQLNVKEVEIKKGEFDVNLDTKRSRELEEEGWGRVVSRKIQSARKKAGLKKENKINLELVLDKDLIGKLESQKNRIKKRVNAKSLMLSLKKKEKFKNSYPFKYKEKKGEINFKKV
jgi:isoleucyl-tRNA synthetase